MRGAFALMAIALVAGGTACGGGGSSESGGAAKREIAADAQAQAKAINLRLSDFPDAGEHRGPTKTLLGRSSASASALTTPA